jgi:hypothetical protein
MLNWYGMNEHECILFKVPWSKEYKTHINAVSAALCLLLCLEPKSEHDFRP